MALNITAGILRRLYQPSTLFLSQRIDFNLIVNRDYAARKGTREKARKKKIKVEQKKVEFVPQNWKKLQKLKMMQKKRINDDRKSEPEGDDVYISKYYKYKRWSFEEAVCNHQETHHPDIYNLPDANLNVCIELNMLAEKKTRFVDNFKRLILLPHPFEHGETRRILVLCKTPELQNLAVETGADLVGGIDMIKNIQNGNLSLTDFDYCVAHPNILPEVTTIKGLLKRKFPSPKSETLGGDIKYMVDKCKYGIYYESKKNDVDHDFGWINTTIGNLNMEIKCLEENFRSLLNDINRVRPRREGSFITKCVLSSPPSAENLLIDLQGWVSDVSPVAKKVDPASPETIEEDDESIEEKRAVS